ncbi:hypothetical protein [Nocardia sp. NPDC050435]|uniref:hypothetical protein n=1 Tax=Nocardia sp. NPDC050435 TaxID=3155040 RepID=UPI0033E95ABA
MTEEHLAGIRYPQTAMVHSLTYAILKRHAGGGEAVIYALGTQPETGEVTFSYLSLSEVSASFPRSESTHPYVDAAMVLQAEAPLMMWGFGLYYEAQVTPDGVGELDEIVRKASAAPVAPFTKPQLAKAVAIFDARGNRWDLVRTSGSELSATRFRVAAEVPERPSGDLQYLWSAARALDQQNWRDSHSFAD